MTCTFYRVFVNQQIPPARNFPNEKAGKKRMKILGVFQESDFQEKPKLIWGKQVAFNFSREKYIVYI